MTGPSPAFESLSSAALLAATRDLVRKSRGVEAELLSHLGEIDERKLYLDCASSSMFAFCVHELGFSEDVAYNRITVARAGRRLPAVVEAVRSGQVHLAGLRLLAPHLTSENHREVLAQAAGRSKREIEELVARLAPQPPAVALVRKLPERPGLALAGLPPDLSPQRAETCAQRAEACAQRETHPLVTPLSEETYKIQFTAGRIVRDKLREAQGLLRHRVPDGDVATIIGKALDLLIDEVKKERFAVGRKARQGPKKEAEALRASGELADPSSSRHIPNAIKREVYARDGGRCSFVDGRGRRCAETSALELDHLDGFARTHRHEAARIRLLCRAHNQHAAEQMYGRAFMEQARASTTTSRSSVAQCDAPPQIASASRNASVGTILVSRSVRTSLV